MCSLSGDVMIEENVVKKSQINKCKKCLTETPSVVLRKTDAYCKSCFLPATVHKFRATLGKHRIIRPNERVLILYEAGHPSTALLHFIRSGLDLETHKKLRLEPVVLYIDEHQISAERLNIYEKISTKVASYNFPGYITSLQNYMSNMTNFPSYIEMKNSIEDSLPSLEGETKNIIASRTLKDDATNICRRQLLIQMAKQLNCGIVFTPDISVDVAINMLSNLSLGRGSHLSLDVGILDDRDPNVKILQPLRYFDMKELAFYNVFNNLEPVSGKKVENSVTQSVNKLISKFVCDLQENYPSTIKTVVRTGDKLTCIKTENICSLCKVPIEIQQELCSSEARNFSHWISTHANTLSTNNIEYNTVISNKNYSNLCFGCRNLSDVLKV